MKKFINWIFIAFIASSCNVSRHTSSKDDGMITATFIQVNDVYEIAPLAGGKEGGMARIATIKKENSKKNPNTFLVIAGDFLSPSVFNSLKYEGKPIRGKQMVDAMNAAGMDFAIFGNHEFDIKESELQDRINESDFQWISTNTFHKINNTIVPFEKTKDGVTTPFPVTFIKSIKDADGTTAKIGFIALTLPFNKAPYVSYADVFSSAKKAYDQLKDSVDAVVAITHQAMEDDEKMAKELPGLAIIIGGHEHDGRFERVGNIYITKALANAKSAYILNLTINKKNHQVTVKPTLEMVDEKIPLDSATNAVVQKWQNIANNSYSSLGFNATQVVLKSGEPLHAKESDVRSHPTNFTKLIVSAIQFAAPKADVVLMNSGSIRLDDILQMPVTEYDLIRSLPFGGGIREVDMKGSLLSKILTQGLNNKGTGGYLQFNQSLHFDSTNHIWILNNNKIEPQQIYRVALTDFLLTGGEANLGYLNPKNPDIVKVYEAQTEPTNPLSDIRTAIIDYLKR